MFYTINIIYILTLSIAWLLRKDWSLENAVCLGQWIFEKKHLKHARTTPLLLETTGALAVLFLLLSFSVFKHLTSFTLVSRRLFVTAVRRVQLPNCKRKDTRFSYVRMRVAYDMSPYFCLINMSNLVLIVPQHYVCCLQTLSPLHVATRRMQRLGRDDMFIGHTYKETLEGGLIRGTSDVARYERCSR